MRTRGHTCAKGGLQGPKIATCITMNRDKTKNDKTLKGRKKREEKKNVHPHKYGVHRLMP